MQHTLLRIIVGIPYVPISLGLWLYLWAADAVENDRLINETLGLGDR